jgi:hypothetical protein
MDASKPTFLRRTFAPYFIDLQGLPVSLKILTVTGYLVVFGQLLFTLLIELAGNRLPMVEYTLFGPTLKVPLVVMMIAGLSFIMGWAYLLTGAAAAKARIFLSVLVLFAVQLFMSTNFMAFLLELLFFFVVLVIYALTFRTPFWLDLPGLYFFGWLGAISLIVIISIGTSVTNAEVASGLSSVFSNVMVLTLMFWILLSFSIIDLGIKTGRFFTRIARGYLPAPSFNALVIFVLLIHPAIAALVIWVTRNSFWSFDLPFSILFFLGALVMWITRRWSVFIGAIFLVLSLATPVVMVGLSMTFAGIDVTESLLKLTGIFPPTLLFVGLTTYNLLGMGVTFTSVDGRILPKRARVLLYFGTLILVVACMLFISHERIATTNQLNMDLQDLINSVISVSAFCLVIPYVVWMLWKKRELLIGPELDLTNPPRWSWLERIPGRAWIAFSLVLACAFSCLIAVILMWMVHLGG